MLGYVNMVRPDAYLTSDLVQKTCQPVKAIGFTYDNVGNRLLRLISVAGPSLTLTNGYGGHGMRRRSMENGVATEYVMDPNTRYYRVLEERAAAGTLDVAYTFGDALLKQSIGPSFYQRDARGSTRVLTDGVQVGTDVYAYEAFGVGLGSSGTTSNKYKFAGEELDVLTGTSCTELRA